MRSLRLPEGDLATCRRAHHAAPAGRAFAWLEQHPRSQRAGTLRGLADRRDLYVRQPNRAARLTLYDAAAESVSQLEREVRARGRMDPLRAPAAEARCRGPRPPAGRRCAAPGALRVWKGRASRPALVTRAEPELIGRRQEGSTLPGGMATSSTRETDEPRLLVAARGGDEAAFGRLLQLRIARSCTRTATGCSAPSRMPRTRCRTPPCAPGAGWPGSRAAARSARGSTRSRPTAAST